MTVMLVYTVHSFGEEAKEMLAGGGRVASQAAPLHTSRPISCSSGEPFASVKTSLPSFSAATRLPLVTEHMGAAVTVRAGLGVCGSRACCLPSAAGAAPTRTLTESSPHASSRYAVPPRSQWTAADWGGVVAATARRVASIGARRITITPELR